MLKSGGNDVGQQRLELCLGGIEPVQRGERLPGLLLLCNGMISEPVRVRPLLADHRPEEFRLDRLMPRLGEDQLIG